MQLLHIIIAIPKNIIVRHQHKLCKINSTLFVFFLINISHKNFYIIHHFLKTDILSFQYIFPSSVSSWLYFQKFVICKNIYPIYNNRIIALVYDIIIKYTFTKCNTSSPITMSPHILILTVLFLHKSTSAHVSLPAIYQETLKFLQIPVYFRISYSALPDNPLLVP